MVTPIVYIKKGRDKPIIQQHPWIFSGAIDRIEGDPEPGDIVTVRDSGNNFLGRGYWNPTSQIQVRILTWQNEEIDEDWWRRMLRRAIEYRNFQLWESEQFEPGGYRIVNAENDYLPGLIVDHYGHWLVLQSLTLGIEKRKPMITKLLSELIRPMGIFERSDADVRGKEGLEPVMGMLWGVEPPEHITIDESWAKFLVDVRKGHKTGHYLDQNENRLILHKLLHTNSHPEAWRILNLFSYTGGFGIAALSAAHSIEKSVFVTNVDSSLEALELAEEITKLNSYPENNVEFVQADVFQFLRDQSAAGEQYDVVILDPPKFASSQQQVEKAARGYKDINLHAFRCVKPGGHLMTFSCSGAVSRDLFQKIVFGALADSGRQAQIVRHLSAAEDHPVALTFPEGEYLKGLLLKVY
jgi:23S rRNA (cytosine1962-C5)-methyltransferase